jgi:hypothetical protein
LINLFCQLSPLFNTAFSFAVKQLIRAQLFLDRTQQIAVAAAHGAA